MLYLGIRGHYEQLPHHTIHIARDYAKNLREIETDLCLAGRPQFYMYRRLCDRPSLAPTGHSGLYISCTGPHQKLGHERGGVQWDSQTRQMFRAKTLQQLKQIGLHDVEERIG